MFGHAAKNIYLAHGQSRNNIDQHLQTTDSMGAARRRRTPSRKILLGAQMTTPSF